MILKYVLPLVALAGVGFAVKTVVAGYQQPIVPRPLAEPPKPPFQAYISGSGLVEASSENVAISVAVQGLVVKVEAKVGSLVKAGDLLFQLDDRDLQAQLMIERASVAASRARLARLEALPRVEDLRTAEAKLIEARAARADAQNLLAMAEAVTDARAMSKEVLSRRRSDVEVADARVAAAQAQLDWHKTGVWKPDWMVAQAELELAQARVQSIQTQVERLNMRAPIDATILQVNVRAGEYAPLGVLARPLLLLGDTRMLHVRVDIDENDAWRFKPAAAARAFVRGNRTLSAPLELARVEPYVVPKRSLTGDSTERVDTRVLQALYRFDPKALPVYVGQQLDVYIEADPLVASSASAPEPPATGQGGR